MEHLEVESPCDCLVMIGEMSRTGKVLSTCRGPSVRDVVFDADVRARGTHRTRFTTSPSRPSAATRRDERRGSRAIRSIDSLAAR